MWYSIVVQIMATSYVETVQPNITEKPVEVTTRRQFFGYTAAALATSLFGLTSCTTPNEPVPSIPVTTTEPAQEVQELPSIERSLSKEEIEQIDFVINAHNAYLDQIGISFLSLKSQDGKDYIDVLNTPYRTRNATQEYIDLTSNWAEESTPRNDLIKEAEIKIESVQMTSDLIGYDRDEAENAFKNIARVTPLRTLTDIRLVNFTNSDIKHATAYYVDGERRILIGSLPAESSFSNSTISHELEHAAQKQLEHHKKYKSQKEFGEYLVGRMERQRAIYEAYLQFSEQELSSPIGGILSGYISTSELEAKYIGIAEKYSLGSNNDSLDVLSQRVMKFVVTQRNADKNYLEKPENEDIRYVYYNIIENLMHQTVDAPFKYQFEKDVVDYESDGETLNNTGKFKKTLMEAKLFVISYEAGIPVDAEEYLKLLDQANLIYPEEKTYAERQGVLAKNGFNSLLVDDEMGVEIYTFPQNTIDSNGKVQLLVALKGERLASEKGSVLELIPENMNAKIQSITAKGQGKYSITFTTGQPMEFTLQIGTSSSRAGGYPVVLSNDQNTKSYNFEEPQIVGYGETAENIKITKGIHAFTGKTTYLIEKNGINFLSDSITVVSDGKGEIQENDIMYSTLFPGERPFVIDQNGDTYTTEFRETYGFIYSSNIPEILSGMNAKIRSDEQQIYDNLTKNNPQNIFSVEFSYTVTEKDGIQIITPVMKILLNGNKDNVTNFTLVSAND